MVKRVFITAPEAYQPRFREAFRRAGVQELVPVFRPFIRTVATPDAAEFRDFVSRHEDFDFIICSSRMAVTVLAMSDIQFSASDGRIIAIGKDQDAVRCMLGVEPALTDAEPSMMGIVEALKRLPKMGAKRVAVLLPAFSALPVPSTITNFLEALALTRADVTTVHCYCTSALGADEYDDVVAALAGDGIDAIALTSGGEAHVLADVLRHASCRGIELDVPVYSFGPYTTKCAHEAGLTVCATSSNFHSFDEYVCFLKRI